MADEDFLQRWSRRKAEAKSVPAAGAPLPDDARPSSDALHPAEPAAAPAAAPGDAPAAVAELPDPAALEPGADISAFMSRGVDEALRRQALKALFQDPRYNVMDGLDIYIDDYSIPDPMPPDWLDKLEQFSHLGDRAARDREAAERAAAEGDLAAAAEAVAEAPVDAAPDAPTDGLADAMPPAASVAAPDVPPAGAQPPPPAAPG